MGQQLVHGIPEWTWSKVLGTLVISIIRRHESYMLPIVVITRSSRRNGRIRRRSVEWIGAPVNMPDRFIGKGTSMSTGNII